MSKLSKEELLKNIENLAEKTLDLKKNSQEKADRIKNFLQYIKGIDEENRKHVSKSLKVNIDQESYPTLYFIYWKKILSILSEDLVLKVDEYYTKNVSEEPQPEYLAHYTSMETVFSILGDPRKIKETVSPAVGDPNKKNIKYLKGLKLYDPSYSNDPTEGNYLKNNVMKQYPWLKKAKKTDAFICSFVSENDKDNKKNGDIGDKINYWQSYGKDGLGCSIQLPKNTLIKGLYPVLYTKDFKELIDYFKPYFELGTLLHNNLFLEDDDKKYFATEFWKSFDKIKYLYKHKGYEYEKEYRFIKLVSSNNKEIKEESISTPPYLKRYVFDEQLSSNNLLKSGSKITIGPRVINSGRLKKYLKKLSNNSKLYGPTFTASKIPYRKV